ncbi:hypothetical protein KBZ16_17425, partial [Vulcanococcus limneticus Candia 3B3]
MRFYAVRTEAIHQTHMALQQLEQGRRGSASPSRAMRVAQLYGHLQCRANGEQMVQVALRDLAAAWHLQPRLLRTDLKDLQALGWLDYSSGPHGTLIRLQNPEGCSEQRKRSQSTGHARGLSAAVGDPLHTEPAPAAAVQLPGVSAAQPVASSEPARSLIDQFATRYNRQRPASWPAYSPRGSALAARLRRAIAHAGGEETFWPLLTQALAGMPEFWRSTYPQGRSGADCASVLFSADRHAAGLGVEFWHVFCWSGAPGIVAGGGVGADVGHAPGPQESDFRRACRLFAWGDHAWRGQGMEAFALPNSEKQ